MFLFVNFCLLLILFFIYRISSCCSKLNFGKVPISHAFPKLDVSNSDYIQVMVTSLPRMELCSLSFLINQSKNVSNIKTNSIQNSWLIDSFTPERNTLDSIAGKRKDDNIDLYFSENCHPASNNVFYIGVKNLRLDPTVEIAVDTLKKNQTSENFNMNAESSCNMQDKHRVLTDLMQDFELGSNKKEIYFNHHNSEFSQQHYLTNKVELQAKNLGLKSRSKSVSPHFAARFQVNIWVEDVAEFLCS